MVNDHSIFWGLVMMENDVPREDDSENDADDVSKNVFFFFL